MKTLILFEEIPENSFFIEVEGDYRHLNNIYINGSNDKSKLDELNNLLYDEEWNFKLTKLDKPTKDWDYFIKCGFIL